MSHQFLVVGLGRLGIAMVNTLDSLGHEVLALDAKEDLIQDLADDLPNVHFVGQQPHRFHEGLLKLRVVFPREGEDFGQLQAKSHRHIGILGDETVFLHLVDGLLGFERGGGKDFAAHGRVGRPRTGRG